MAYRQRISGSIDSYGWFRWNIQHVLNQHKDEEVHLVIMSPGGVVNEAIAISDMLAEHGKVTVEFSGLAASAATWLAFGASRVLMHEDTLWLCHKSSMLVSKWSQMNADELDAYIEKLQSQQNSLEVIDAIVAKKYYDRAKDKGKTLQQIFDLMKEERYLPAADCLAWGFVDEILPTKSSKTGDEVTVSNELLNAIKLPLIENGSHEQPSDDNSLYDRIMQGLKDFFKNISFASQPDAAQVPVTSPQNSSENENNNQQQLKMNKDFVSINALLGVEGVEVAEDKATLTVAQLTAIENRLKAVAEAENALDAVSPKVKGMTGIGNKVAAVTLMLDRAPVAPYQVNKPEGGSTNEVQVENGDEITNEARSMVPKK